MPLVYPRVVQDWCWGSQSRNPAVAAIGSFYHMRSVSGTGADHLVSEQASWQSRLEDRMSISHFLLRCCGRVAAGIFTVRGFCNKADEMSSVSGWAPGAATHFLAALGNPPSSQNPKCDFSRAPGAVECRDLWAHL